jgi:hypothetical protein
MQMKYKLFVLLISISSACSAEYTYNIDEFQVGVSGFAFYTNASNEHVVHDSYDTVLNISLCSKFGYITSQFATNEFNPVRRLQANIPVYTSNTDQVEFSFGRLTTPIGLINTSSNSPQISGVLMLPLSTYDPRRYHNFPDITDGAQLTYVKQLNDTNIKVKVYGGKQLVDDPIIDLYGSDFSMIGKSDDLIGMSARIERDNLTLKYTYTNTNGTILSTEPPAVINYINRHASQHIHFGGFQYNYDQYSFQGEATYRALNTVTDELGTYLKVNYNIQNKLSTYVGHSYGTRIGVTSTIHDTFAGISNTFSKITVALEYHYTQTNNWYFEYDRPTQNTSTLLTTIVYSF